MAAERLSRRWLIISAVVALAALLGLGASIMFVVSMAGAPDTAGWVAPFVGAALACIVLTGAVPVFKAYAPLPRWARWAVPIFVGIFAIVAAAAVWILMSLLLCETDGVCRPVDTWRAVPGFIACGILVASGPGLGALAANENWRGRSFAATIVLGILGVFLALAGWVELNIYPLA